MKFFWRKKAEEPVEQTEEQVAGDPAEEPAEELTEGSAEEPGAELTEGPVEEPSAEAVGVPVAEPVMEPAEEAEEVSAEPESETAAEGPSAEEEVAEEATAEEEASEEPSEGEEVIEEAASEEEVAEEAASEEAAAEEEPAPKAPGFFSRLFSGLGKTRRSITGSLNRLFSSHDRIDDDFYDDLEEIMVMGDMGIRTTDEILEELKERVAAEKIRDPMECRGILIDSIKEKMAVKETDYAFETVPSVILMIGVNGTGKTTSAGKLASILKAQGRKVILAAADTFRAAACEQLREWANRARVDLISGQEGADPASVVYDAVAAAKARKADVLICDTAGRLHNKKNLMDELSKIYRIIGREYPEAHLETLLVLDGTTGQNALVQAKEFSEAADVTGIILTKLDGTARGGIAVAIQSELQVPVKYIGVGETLEDLQKFDPDSFVDALFEEHSEEFAE